MRMCKRAGIDPRGSTAPPGMASAIQKFYGDLSERTREEIRALAEENLVLYATGTKSRPSLSFYDAGEGQLASDFPKTFCSLVYGSDEGSYKAAHKIGVSRPQNQSPLRLVGEAQKASSTHDTIRGAFG
jgi:hypothetical protein